MLSWGRGNEGNTDFGYTSGRIVCIMAIAGTMSSLGSTRISLRGMRDTDKSAPGSPKAIENICSHRCMYSGHNQTCEQKCPRHFDLLITSYSQGSADLTKLIPPQAWHLTGCPFTKILPFHILCFIWKATCQEPNLYGSFRFGLLHQRRGQVGKEVGGPVHVVVSALRTGEFAHQPT